MGPITWRNIQGPNFGTASRILQQAGNHLQQGIAGIGNFAREGEDRRLDGIQTNSDAFLEAARSQFRDPDALRQAQSSGALDKLRAGFGELDTGRTGTGAIDSLVQAGQQRTIADNAFEQSQDTAAARPLVDEFNSLLARGDTEGARSFLDNNEIPGGEGTLERDLSNEQTTLTREAERVSDRKTREDDRQRTIGIQNERLGRERAAEKRSLEEATRLKTEREEAETEQKLIQDTLGNVVSQAQDNETESDLRADGLLALRKAGLDVSEAAAISSNYFQNLAANTGVTQGESEQHQTRLTGIANKYAGNPIIQNQAAGVTQSDVVNSVYENLNERNFFDKVDNTEADAVNKVLSNIVDKGGFEFRGKVIPMSETNLNIAISKIDPDRWITDAITPDELLDEIISEMAEEGSFTNQIEEYEAYQAEVNTANEGFNYTAERNAISNIAQYLR